MFRNYYSCFKLWKLRKVSLTARNLSNSLEQKRICIVGSGPAGFYTAIQLLKSEITEVDIFEKLPVPFGLIRYGVAPDHPEIRKVCRVFTEAALKKRCNFYGNITVGKDVKIPELLESYHAVVLAFGASNDKSLDIPGEDSQNVFPARKFVGWYTGHPEFVDEIVDLDTDVATIIGQGNVALDVARMLLRDPNELKTTDVSEHAFEALKKSRVKRVVMTGRRGPLQVAFTIKEFREVTQLQGCHVTINDPIASHLYEKANELQMTRIRKRMLELLSDLYKKNSSSSSTIESCQRCLEVKFLRTPKEIVPNDSGKVEKVIFNVNKIKNSHDALNPEVELTNEEEILNSGLVVRSVGYKGSTIDPYVSFDERKNKIPNVVGRITDKEGLYCSGWVKTGPVGVIVATMNGSYETGATLLRDLYEGDLSQRMPPKSRDDIFSLLQARGVKIVTFDDWQRIDSYELEKGKSLGKARAKIYTVQEMLNCVDNSQ